MNGVLWKVSSGWHENYINYSNIKYSNTTKNNILFIDVSASRRKPSSGLTFGAGCQYVIDWANAKVIDRESNKAGRLIREAVWIRKTDNMNRDEGSYNWATYGTSLYILTTGTGSQFWWRLPTWSRNVDKQYVVFGCIRVINIVNGVSVQILTVLFWCLAAACNLSLVYGLYGSANGSVRLSNAVASFYAAVHRTAWAVGVAWVIFACVTGNAGQFI